jgi:hypothetical protein
MFKISHEAISTLWLLGIFSIKYTYNYFLVKETSLGCYSETGFNIDMDRNFVCLWRRHNCN